MGRRVDAERTPPADEPRRCATPDCPNMAASDRARFCSSACGARLRKRVQRERETLRADEAAAARVTAAAIAFESPGGPAAFGVECAPDIADALLDDWWRWLMMGYNPGRQP
jgi:hypothetical protein